MIKFESNKVIYIGGLEGALDTVTKKLVENNLIPYEIYTTKYKLEYGSIKEAWHYYHLDGVVGVYPAEFFRDMSEYYGLK